MGEGFEAGAGVFSAGIVLIRAGTGGADIASLGGVRLDCPHIGVAERADNRKRVLLVVQARRHGGKLAFFEHVHEERFENVIKVMAEREFVVAVLDRKMHKLVPPLV